MSATGFDPSASSTGKKRRNWPWVTGAVVGGLLIIGAIDPAGSRDRVDTSPAVAQPAAETASTVLPTDVVEESLSVAPVAPVSVVGDEAAGAADAVTRLATLPIKGRAAKTGYDRQLFGQAWSDDVAVAGGHNGCDTRNDILHRDLNAVVVKPGSNGCAVASGVLVDPYTGTSIDFVRGSGSSNAVQIDHVVALSDAWQKGAQQLDPATLRNFANDPRNLQATDGPTNQQKSDGDAATWLPANKKYRCTYVTRQLEVKAAYRLWITQAEHDAIARVLANCGTTISPTTTTTAPAPRTTAALVIPATPSYTPAPADTPTPAYKPAPALQANTPSSTSYSSCAAVRAAGAAPIYAGHPGYSRNLDRDGDGVACEN